MNTAMNASTDASIGVPRPSRWHRATVVAMLAGAAVLAGCERPPIESVQRGFRGTGMDQVYNPRTVAASTALNTAPADTPPVPAGGPPASTVFKNLQVLGDLSVGEMTRLMVSMTTWVAPQQGCTYCHTANFAEDTLYTKVVARRMLQMTNHINTDWKAHVAQTGVTCYTCHRGQPVPANLWFNTPASTQSAYAGNKAGQNAPSSVPGLASLPNDPFTPFLSQGNDIRVVGTTALPTANRKSIKQAEWTYGLMMHMSESLGVNCTYCHNSRSFAEWDTSTPQRGIAWYGIRMARDLNATYLEPLHTVFPPQRLGAGGDSAKLNCATCHQGAFKPLYGASLLSGHPELMRVKLEPGPRGAVPTAAATAAGVTATAAAASIGSDTSALVLFAVGSPVLSPDSAKLLAPLVEAAKANPTAKLTVSGYHSASGDLAQNQELAKQRAFAVRDELKSAGVQEDRIVLEKPQSTEANIAGEDPQARRVEVSLK